MRRSSLNLGTPILSLAVACAISAGTAIAHGVVASDRVAVKAGTIHLVEGGAVIEGGGTILIEDGRIVAVGKDVVIPRGVRVVDYGADAVLVPGLIAADSRYGGTRASPRTAEPELLATDNLDVYSNFTAALTGGVTTVYMAPASNRLIGGQGAVVKSASIEGKDRILEAHAGLHGSIAKDARSTPGFWEPPIPATVDVGMAVALPQLPRTTMGAVVALDELLNYAKTGVGGEYYGPYAGPALAQLMERGTSWRMRAERAGEIQALLAFFADKGLPLVIEGGNEAAGLASAIASAGIPVIVDVSIARNNGGPTLGSGADAVWPSYDVASQLVAAGVKVAIAPGGNGTSADLRLAASLARRGGMNAAQALRTITLDAAEILGVAARVGSLVAGKDADLTVLNGAPLDLTSTVLATWVDGEIAWKAHETGSVVLEVDELHLGDGHTLKPGQLLMKGGKIVEIGTRVSHPLGATVIRGAAAMPGIIDTFSHLGLEGSSKSISPRFNLSQIVEPGDQNDRRVAKAGVTSVILASKNSPGKGSQTMAYKPAGDDVEAMVIDQANAIRMQWSSAIRTTSGKAVRDALKKAAEYKSKWAEYEKAKAAFVPPAPKVDDEEEDEEEEDEEEEDEDDDKKKKDKDEDDARPVTGVWEGPGLRLMLSDDEGSLQGSLRAADYTEGLIELAGERDEKDITLGGLGSEGAIELKLTLDKDKLTGSLTISGGTAAEVEITQASTEYVIADRPERRKPESKPSAPKGTPKPPSVSADLEPLRRALAGDVTVIVSVERRDEILACVDFFAGHGIKPVLYGASEAHIVAEKIKGRVSGVLLTHQVTAGKATTGTQLRNRYADLQQAGIAVAFYSNADTEAANLRDKAAFAVSQGMSPSGAMRALTADAATMMSIDDRVGRLLPGLDADVLLLDGSPLDVSSSIQRVWVNGKEIR